jgi:hypothetical protein
MQKCFLFCALILLWHLTILDRWLQKYINFSKVQLLPWLYLQTKFALDSCYNGKWITIKHEVTLHINTSHVWDLPPENYLIDMDNFPCALFGTQFSCSRSCQDYDFDGKILKSGLSVWSYCFHFCCSYCQIFQRWVSMVKDMR